MLAGFFHHRFYKRPVKCLQVDKDEMKSLTFKKSGFNRSKMGLMDWSYRLFNSVDMNVRKVYFQWRLCVMKMLKMVLSWFVVSSGKSQPLKVKFKYRCVRSGLSALSSRMLKCQNEPNAHFFKLLLSIFGQVSPCNGKTSNGINCGLNLWNYL